MFRRILSLVGAVCLSTFLAACGFEPVYGSNSPYRGKLTSVSFADPRTENDFGFLRYVQQEVPINQSNTKYLVNYSVSIGGGSALSDLRVRRGIVSYQVSRIETGDNLFSGNVRAISDYRERSGPSGNIVNRRVLQTVDDALLQQLAQMMHMELIAKFASCGPSC